MDKPDFDDLVQALVNASHEEGRQEAFGTEPMQHYYDRTHAAVNALLNAIQTPAATTKPASEPVRDAASVEGLMEDARVDWLLSPQCKISPKRQLQEAQLIQQVWDAAIRAYAQRRGSDD